MKRRRKSSPAILGAVVLGALVLGWVLFRPRALAPPVAPPSGTNF